MSRAFLEPRLGASTLNQKQAKTATSHYSEANVGNVSVNSLRLETRRAQSRGDSAECHGNDLHSSLKRFVKDST